MRCAWRRAARQSKRQLCHLQPVTYYGGMGLDRAALFAIPTSAFSCESQVPVSLLRA